MKRLISAIIFLIVIITSCRLSYLSLYKNTESVRSKVLSTDAAVFANNMESALKEMNDAHTEWKNLQIFLGALIRHDEIDQINNLFTRAQQALDIKNSNDYLIESSELKSMLRHLPEMETPKFSNIF